MSVVLICGLEELLHLDQDSKAIVRMNTALSLISIYFWLF